MSIKKIEAGTQASAEDQARRMITQRYNGELRLCKATLTQIQEDLILPIGQWYDESDKRVREAKQKILEKTERAELERLQNKYKGT